MTVLTIISPKKKTIDVCNNIKIDCWMNLLCIQLIPCYETCLRFYCSYFTFFFLAFSSTEPYSPYDALTFHFSHDLHKQSVISKSMSYHHASALTFSAKLLCSEAILTRLSVLFSFFFLCFLSSIKTAFFNLLGDRQLTLQPIHQCVLISFKILILRPSKIKIH